MRLSLDLPDYVSEALRRYGVENELPADEAAEFALTDWLVAHGYLDVPDVLDEDTETVGSA